MKSNSRIIISLGLLLLLGFLLFKNTSGQEATENLKYSEFTQAVRDGKIASIFEKTPFFSRSPEKIYERASKSTVEITALGTDFSSTGTAAGA